MAHEYPRITEKVPIKSYSDGMNLKKIKKKAAEPVFRSRHCWHEKRTKMGEFIYFEENTVRKTIIAQAASWAVSRDQLVIFTSRSVVRCPRSASSRNAKKQRVRGSRRLTGLLEKRLIDKAE